MNKFFVAIVAVLAIAGARASEPELKNIGGTISVDHLTTVSLSLNSR
jgi:hypothetical protein